MPAAVVGGLMTRASRVRGAVTWVVVSLVGATVGGAAVWQLVGPSAAPAADVAATRTYTVQAGSVGRTASYTVQAERRRVPLGVLGGSGVVTAHGTEPGVPVASGTVLLRVDERPVVLLDGAVPSYRDLEVGVRGEDVRQLQELLVSAGLLRAAPDGVLGPATVRAVRAWQRTLGLDPDGVVRQGDVVFSPALPGWVDLDPGVAVGARVDAGTDLGSVQVGDPAFALVAEDGQRRLPGAGETVVVVAGDRRWTAVTGEASTGAAGRVTVPLGAPGGGPVCGDECDAVPPAEGEVLLTGEVVVVPEVSGAVVPVAALRTGADGTVSVVVGSGDEVVVQVVAGDGGRAVVEGVAPGQVVLLADEDPA